MLESSRDRVRAIALAYAHGWGLAGAAADGRVDPTSVLRAMVEEIKALHPASTCAISIDVREVRLSFDQLIPVVLLSRELVANAFAHAFLERARGAVSLALAPKQGERAELTIADDGVGMPEDLSTRREKRLGLALVTMLAEQLQADVTTVPAPTSGCRWVLSFPLE